MAVPLGQQVVHLLLSSTATLSLPKVFFFFFGS